MLWPRFGREAANLARPLARRRFRTGPPGWGRSVFGLGFNFTSHCSAPSLALHPLLHVVLWQNQYFAISRPWWAKTCKHIKKYAISGRNFWGGRISPPKVPLAPGNCIFNILQSVMSKSVCQLSNNKGWSKFVNIEKW